MTSDEGRDPRADDSGPEAHGGKAPASPIGDISNAGAQTRVARFFRTRGVRFWSVSITAASIIVLFVGSQIAHDRGQTVDWYTGFGQWLGALASFAAAGAALYISLSDRRHSNEERRQIEERQDADLCRQAGLVRVTAESLGQRQPVGPMNMRPSIGIRNRRADRIFDVEVVKLIHDGEEHELLPPRVNGFSIYPARPDQKHWYVVHQLEGLVLETDEWLVIHQQSALPNRPADSQRSGTGIAQAGDGRSIPTRPSRGSDDRRGGRRACQVGDTC